MISRTMTVTCDICGRKRNGQDGYTHMTYHHFIVRFGREEFEDFCIICRPRVMQALKQLQSTEEATNQAKES